jgi:predicted ATPase
VPTAVAQALELKEEPGRSLVESIAARVAGKRTLLLLDNAEHLLPDVAADVAMLRDAGGPTVLVTSRERLQLQGEHVWPVPPLDERDGVALFTERARALNPSFTPSAELDVLCDRLDKLPLALELAAARTPLFTPAQLLDRLGQRLDFLKGGRDTDPRHLTLRATIAWSYDLLGPEEQQLLRRLSVFPAGCTYEAAESVCAADPDLLQSLLDKSLLRRRETDDEPRYWMLETIREYAAELLEAHGEADATRSLLVDWAESFAVAAEPGWLVPESGVWTCRFLLELDNVREGMRRAYELARPHAALTICACVGWLWRTTGLFREGLETIELARARLPQASASLQGLALSVHGLLAVDRGQSQLGEELTRESLPLLVHPHVRVFGLCTLAELLPDDSPEADRLLLEAEAEARALGFAALLAVPLSSLALRALRAGDLAGARAYLEEGLRGESRQRGFLVNCLAIVELLGGELARARELLADARELATQPQSFLYVDLTEASVELISGDADAAGEHLAAARRVLEDLGLEGLRPRLLLAEAAVHTLRGEHEAALERRREAERAREAHGLEWGPEERVIIERVLGSS